MVASDEGAGSAVDLGMRELERVESALRESEARFRTLTELSSDFYWEQDDQFRFVERVGYSWEKRAYPATEAIGKTRWELPALNMREADWQRHRADLQAHREFRDLEIERPLPSGGTRWISTSGRPIFDAEGRFRGYRGIGRDITEIKQAELRLKQSEAEVRSIVDNVPAMIAHFDPQLRYVYVNRHYAEFFGDSPERFIGQSTVERLGEAGWQRIRPYVETALAGDATSFEGRFRRADGELRELSVQLVPHRDAARAVIGVHGLVLDVTQSRATARSLLEREAQLRLVVDNVPAMICYFDTEYRYQYANRGYVEFYARGQPVVGKTVREGLGEQVWQAARTGIERSVAGETVNYQRSHVSGDGTVRELDVTLVPHRDAKGKVLGVHTMILDVTERRRAESALRLRNRAIEASLNSIMITEPAGDSQRIVYVNAAFEQITGYSTAEALGRSPRFLHGPDAQQAGIAALRAATREEREVTVLLRNFRKDGTPFWNELHVAPVPDETGRVTHFVGVSSDVSERIRYQEEIERYANYDSLTGLPNRNLLNDRLGQAVAQAERSGHPFAVMFVDLDHLKRINDSVGHGIGDQVIAATGKRIADCLRTGDTVARIGGDEYVVLLTDLQRPDDAAAVADKIQAGVQAPLEVEAHEFVLSMSAGIAVYPRDGGDAMTLLRNADAALYQAKAEGRGCFRFFAPEMNAQVVQYVAIENDLRNALHAQEFRLQYQPIVRIATGEMVGAEALLRWHRADGNVISPAEFIPVAEESGLIVPLGYWVFENAARQAKALNAGTGAPVYVSINLSARQFRDPRLLEMIRTALARIDVDPALLKLEITESTVMHRPEQTVVTLRALKDLGLKLSVDDFGTGYSSLAYLKRFPIDTLKIDRAFIRDLADDPDDFALTRAIIDLARALELEVVAEGIEKEDQAKVLAAIGCAVGQGFLFARPMDAAHLQEYEGRRAR